MAKIALLVGVSQYPEGIDNLPAAVRDAAALQEVLENSNIGEFDKVKLLTDANKLSIEVEIHDLFNNRKPDDILLFYFSGHGFRDRKFNFHLGTSETRKNEQGVIIPPTAIAASYLQDQLTNSRSERQVIILDCCFSEAFVQGMRVKGEIDLETQLGGKGRAILTSSSDKQYSFESDDSQLSIYTRYLVDALKTGAADVDDDGWITPDELHNYVEKEIKKSTPAMTPKFYSIDEGLKIYLARSPVTDPKLKYRKECDKLVNQGKFSSISRRILDRLCLDLQLTEAEAKAIESEVLQPYVDYQQKLQEYKEAYAEAIEQEYPLNDRTRQELREFQKLLGLRDEDINPIETRLTPKEVAKPENNPPANTDEIELRSEKGVDYTKLRDLLAAGKWKEADQETFEVMLITAGRQEERYFITESIENFPCEDLRTIDQLWVKYSKGRFGFSVQKKIWLEVGGTVDYETEKKLGDHVGWRKEESWLDYHDLNFDITAPIGHLPKVDTCRNLRHIFDRKREGLRHLDALPGMLGVVLLRVVFGEECFRWFSSCLVQRFVTCNI